jgi:hypothetical protein
MTRTMKLLVVANPGIDSEELRDAILRRAAEGPVHVTLVAPAAVGAGPLAAPPGTAADRVVQARHAATVALGTGGGATARRGRAGGGRRWRKARCERRPAHLGSGSL